MNLGGFTVCLSVKDIHKSLEFYTKLGFTKKGGDLAHNYIVLRNGNAVIGLFQGMFEKNMLCFIPGWDQDGKPVDPFTDVRELQKLVKKTGIPLETEADESTSGPASFTMSDPDGNPILFDQYR